MRYDQPFFVGINNERFPHRDAFGYLPALETSDNKEEPEPIVKPTFVYFKNDVRALELNNRVTDLENFKKYLLEKEKGKRGIASKEEYEPF